MFRTPFYISTPKMVRNRQCLRLFTWKRVSRHNGMQLFISYLARWRRTRRFSKPTFRPSGATNQHLGKHNVSQVSYLFRLFTNLHLFFSHSFSCLTFSLLLFSSLTLSPSAFSSVHIGGNLTSKLPSLVGNWFWSACWSILRMCFDHNSNFSGQK